LFTSNKTLPLYYVIKQQKATIVNQMPILSLAIWEVMMDSYA